MLQEGIDMSLIIKITGLTEQQIREYQKQLMNYIFMIEQKDGIIKKNYSFFSKQF